MKLAVSFVASLALLAQSVQAMHLGLAWAADNTWAHQLIGNPLVNSYHHWEVRFVSPS